MTTDKEEPINPFASQRPLVVEIGSNVDILGFYVEGYFWSAKRLLETLITSDKFENPWALFPILFLIRHYFELSLKDILKLCGYIKGENLEKEIHPLDELLVLVQKAAREYYSDNRNRLGGRLLVEDLDETFKMIRNAMSIHLSLDNESFSFRYPYTKNGMPSYEGKLDFSAQQVYDSLMAFRKHATQISTQLLCDDLNPMFKDEEKPEPSAHFE